MVDWPAGLPQFMLSGITDQRQNAKLRSSVDSGPPIQRRRYTAAVRNINIPVTFTNAERAIFDTFFASDLQEGTLRFNWKDPVSGSTTALRFRGDPPNFDAKGGGTTKRWDATLELEILP